MKNIKILLALMAFIAIKTNAQQNAVAVYIPSKSYAINIRTAAPVQSEINLRQDVQTGSDAEKSKSFSKSFSVNNNDKVNLNNQYGIIVIKPWDKKEVKVDIDIKAYSNSASDVRKLIDDVTIDATKTGDVVSIRTDMGDGNGRYGRRTRNGAKTWRREVKVNFTVYLPAVNPLTVMQQYGNIEMGDFSGPTSLKVQYGNLIARNLSNSNNYINVQYGKINIQEINAAIIKHEYGGGVTIGSIGTLELNAEYVPVSINTIRKSADIKVQYGDGLTVGTIGGNLLLNSEYAKVNINNIKGNTVAKQSYANLSITSLGKIALKTEYSNVILGALNGDANIDMDYNRLSITEVTPACKNFTFNGEYVSVGIGFNDRYKANLTVSSNYAGFKYGSNISASKISDDDETKKYSGKIGGGGMAVVYIKSEYGSITLK